MYRQSSDGLSNNQIERLLVVDARKILIATRNGLDLLDPLSGALKQYQPDPKQNFEENWFNSLAIYRDTIFAATFHGLHLLSKDLKSLKYFPNLNPERSSTRLVHLPGKNQLLYLNESRLYRYQNQSLVPYKDFSFDVLSILPQGEDYLLGTRQGLKYWSPRSQTLKPIHHPTIDKALVLDMELLKNGAIALMSDQGLFVGDEGQWEHYHSSALGRRKLSHSLCLALLEDRQGQVWLGTGQGLSIIDPRHRLVKSLSHYRTTDGQLERLRNIEALHADTLRGALWVGCADKLILLKENQNGDWEEREIGEPFAAGGQNIDYLFADGNKLWVGTAQGSLYKGRPGAWETLIGSVDLKQLRGIRPGPKPKTWWLGFADG